jgi:hypothetical protein
LENIHKVSAKEKDSRSKKRRFLMAKKIFILGVALIMCLGLFVGCRDIELKKGIYRTDDGLESITLLEDDQFIFNRNIMASYRPEGSYSIKKDNLTLHMFLRSRNTFLSLKMVI